MFQFFLIEWPNDRQTTKGVNCVWYESVLERNVNGREAVIRPHTQHNI